MADWVHRTTKRFLRSTSPASLIEARANYIESPDLNAVSGFESKYWTISGDVISLLDQAARDAIDAAEDSSDLDGIADQLQQNRSLDRAFAEVVLDEFNVLRALHGLPDRTLSQLRNAVRGKL